MVSFQQFPIQAAAGPPASGARAASKCSDVCVVGRQLLVDGQPVIIGARAFDVLNILLQHRDEVVSKKLLLDAAWPGMIVEENNLQVQISNLRRVLGHDAITTIPGHGYQLNVPQATAPAQRIAREEGARTWPPGPPPGAVADGASAGSDLLASRTSASSGAFRSWALPAMGIAFALASAWGVWRVGEVPPNLALEGAAGAGAAQMVDRSVAVLPFTDMSEKQDLGYFSEGIAEEVLHLLSKVPEMHVAARTSSFSFKDKSDDLPTMARKMQVANVLEGSVRRSGNSLRITAQLVRADNGFRLWSQTYDRTLGDIFQIQEEIAASVVQALQLSLLGQSLPQSMDNKRLEAYTLYLQGRSLLMHASTPADWADVDEYARRAVSADVGYAPSWAFFARVLADRAQLEYIPGESGWEAAREAATRSLALDPGLREGQLAIASIALRFDWNWVAAQQQIDAVLQQDPGNAQAMSWAGYLALAQGQKDRAIAYFERAAANDPLDPNQYIRLGDALYLSGRYADAQFVLRKALALHSGQAFAHWTLARIAIAGGDPAAALTELEREPNEAARLAGRAIAFHALGHKAESDAALAELQQQYGKRAAVYLATIHAYRGNLDRAFTELDRGFEARDTNCLFVGVDPLLANLRANARYAAFLNKMKLPMPGA